MALSYCFLPDSGILPGFRTIMHTPVFFISLATLIGQLSLGTGNDKAIHQNTLWRLSFFWRRWRVNGALGVSIIQQCLPVYL